MLLVKEQWSSSFLFQCCASVWILCTTQSHIVRARTSNPRMLFWWARHRRVSKLAHAFVACEDCTFILFTTLAKRCADVMIYKLRADSLKNVVLTRHTTHNDVGVTSLTSSNQWGYRVVRSQREHAWRFSISLHVLSAYKHYATARDVQVRSCMARAYIALPMMFKISTHMHD